VNRKPAGRKAKPIASNRNPRPQAANPENHSPGRNNPLITNRAAPLALPNRPRTPSHVQALTWPKRIDPCAASRLPKQHPFQGMVQAPKLRLKAPITKGFKYPAITDPWGPIEAASISKCWFLLPARPTCRIGYLGT
jgi:hypothetical protein